MSVPFILDADALAIGERGTEYPSIRAASNLDSRILSAVLEHGRVSQDAALSPNAVYPGYIFGKWNTPLLAAILASSTTNVRILLSAGANPDGGLHLDDMRIISTRFTRLRDWEDEYYDAEQEYAELLDFQGIEDTQAPLTAEELQQRRHGFSRFWTEHELIPLDREINADKLPPVIAAASVGSLDILDMILAAGADVRAWKISSQADAGTLEPSSAALALATPLHAAIKQGHTSIVEKLLERGFDPNIVPLHAAAHAMPPLAACMLTSPPNTSAFDVLAADERTHLTQATPVYGVNALHFAVAAHDQGLLTHIAQRIPLARAGATAIGHTLMHIACLPLNDRHVQIFAPKCYVSIHEVRTVDALWKPLQLLPPDKLNGALANATPSWSNYRFTTGSNEDPFPRPDSAFLIAQRDIVQYLFEHDDTSKTQMGTQDMHGNTPLHYLAGHRVLNPSLITWLLDKIDGAKTAWSAIKNDHGFTAEELYEEGSTAVEDPHKPFWEWLTNAGFVV